MEQRGDSLFVLSPSFDALVAAVPLPFELWTQRQFSIAAYPLVAQHTIHQVKLCITVPCQTILMNCLSKFYYFVKLLSGSFGFHTSKIYQLSGLCKSQTALFHFIGHVLSKLELLIKPQENQRGSK